MSAASVMRHCGKFLATLPLGAIAMQDISYVLKQTNESILQLMYELAIEAGLSHDEACTRVLPVLLQSCAIHLADDIADGDCDYLLSPHSQGSTALFTLQQLVSLSLYKCALPNTLLVQTAKLLALVGAAQHQEIATQKWNLDSAISAAKGLNGYQFEAYFSIVSANTEVHGQFQTLGHSYGIVNHIANDIMSNDVRYLDLPTKDRAALRAWTLAHAKNIASADIKPLTSFLPALLRHIR